MRRVLVHVDAADAQRIAQMASRYDAADSIIIPAHRTDGTACAIVMVYLPNRMVGPFAEDVQEHVTEALITLPPQDILPVPIPFGDNLGLAGEVSHTSSLELIVGAFQSIGSWTNLLLYAAFSGIVAAYAVIFNISFLLVAAMLIAPMGAPVMVCVVGTAIGDSELFLKGAYRFFVAIAILVFASFLLGAVYGFSFTSTTMDQIASLSGWVVLIALIGGAAGALSQLASERNSFISASTTGFLIAVALSPASAVLGLALLIGRWEYAWSMALVLILTFGGVVAGGAVMLGAMGTRRGPRGFRHGSGGVKIALSAILLISLSGLILLQQSQPRTLMEADVARRAAQIARSAAVGISGVRLLGVTAEFVPVENPRGRILLVRAVVERMNEQVNADSALNRVRREFIHQLRKLPEGVQPHLEISTIP